MPINLQKEPVASSKNSSKSTKTIAIVAAAILALSAIAGLLLKNSNNASPNDKDKDGIADTIDRCPDEPGTVENSGCAAQNGSLTEVNEASGGKPKEAAAPSVTSKPATDQNEPVNKIEKTQQPVVNNQNRAENIDEPKPVQKDAITFAEPEEIVAKNVSAKLKANSGANVINWNSELSKAKDLILTISTSSGLNFKKDVTGLTSYTFNPGSGEWQGKKCTVSLTSSDPKITIDNAKLPNTFFNCSAE